LLAFAAAIARDPIAANNAPTTPVPQQPIVLATPPPLAPAAPRRDPFEGDAAGVGPGPNATPPALPAPPPLPVPLGSAPLGAPGAERVAAIATGARPYALVASGDRTRVVTIGDRVDGASITAIAIDGVRLSDGRTLTIAAADAVLPAPARTQRTLGDSP
jgi:hypothetical protein